MSIHICLPYCSPEGVKSGGQSPFSNLAKKVGPLDRAEGRVADLPESPMSMCFPQCGPRHICSIKLQYISKVIFHMTW